MFWEFGMFTLVLCLPHLLYIDPTLGVINSSTKTAPKK